MRTRRRKIFILTVCLICLFTAFSFAACKKDGGNGGGNNGGSSDVGVGGSAVSDAVVSDYFISLNSNRLTLSVGETFDLSAKLVNANGDEKSAGALTFKSEADKVAEVSLDGTVTAKAAGEVYINVISEDGSSAACFVTVVAGDKTDGTPARIFLRDDTLYEGVDSQAIVFLYKDGVRVPTSDLQITWSVSDNDKCSVSSDGVLTPNSSSGSVTVYASFVYEGKNYSLERTVTLNELAYYKISRNSIKLATAKTVSDRVNTLYTDKNFSVLKVDLKNKTETEVPFDDYSVSVSGDTVKAEKGGVSECKVTALKAGSGTVTVSSDLFNFVVNVSASVSVSSVADMDVLALATLNDKTLLAADYIMTNDIDFENNLVYPIAAHNDSPGNRLIGVQWKYVLDKVGDKYAFVDRNAIDKVNGSLSEDEFRAFIANGGININNTGFTGTFDGNGYSIKNAKMMFGAYIHQSDYRAAYQNIFGNVNNGTIMNIGFDNITLQTADEPYLQTLYGNNGLVMEGKKAENNGRGYSVIGRALNSTIKNVFVRETTVFSSDGMHNAVIIRYGNANTSLTNCVVDLVSTSTSGFSNLAAFSGEACGTVANNIAVGTLRGHFTVLQNGRNEGQNGNWWCDKADRTSFATASDIEKLFSTPVGSNAINVKSVSETAETFDKQIWNTEKFNITDKELPSLIKGCSVA